MAALLFGTGGAPRSARSASSLAGIERIAELGLSCMEVEFVQGVRMGERAAKELGNKAAELGVRLTAHAPYFINFNAQEPDKLKASQERLLQTARIGALCGVESVAFHSAFYLGDSPGKTYGMVKKCLSEVLAQLRKENNHIRLRPEVMGRPTQFGTLEELLDLCAEMEGVAPCVDFAHWHARTGKANSYVEFKAVLQKIKERLGRPATENMHMHVSGIAYGQKGEIKHVNLKESDFKYVELLRAMKEWEAAGFVICESPNLEEDALLMQKTYESL